MTTRRLQSVVALLLVLATGGCIVWDDAGFDRVFRDAQTRWPVNVDELREYMVANHPQEAREVAWDRLQDVTFTSKDDGGLRINHTVLPGRFAMPAKTADGVKSELELNLPKPPGPFLPPIRVE